MKLPIWYSVLPLKSRAPQGARGLKSVLPLPELKVRLSRPARGAWIEMRPKYRLSRR